jgi:hypothetical protein
MRPRLRPLLCLLVCTLGRCVTPCCGCRLLSTGVSTPASHVLPLSLSLSLRLPLTAKVLLAGRLRRGGADDSVDPLVHYLATDPHGDQDVFHQLTAAEMDHFADDQPELGVDELLSKARSFPLSTHVNIKLIGWDGRGRYGIQIKEALLSRALKELHSDLPVTVLSQASDGAEAGGSVLPVVDKFYFSVEHSSAALLQGLNNVVGTAVTRASAARTGKGGGAGWRARVSRAEIDALLSADFESTSLSHTIYIANLDPAGVAPEEVGAYSYIGAEEGEGTGCHVCHWPAAQLRYTFLDVSAHCGRFGPRGLGEGVVSPRLLPLITNHASVRAPSPMRAPSS